MNEPILYWTVQTGMGAAFCLTALLGLVVGAGIIGQTVFANTMEHLGEFATLKAMGATRRDLNTVILVQAALDAAMGFGVAVPLALLSKSPLEKTGVTLAVDMRLIAFLFCRNARHRPCGGVFIDPPRSTAGSGDDLPELR